MSNTCAHSPSRRTALMGGAALSGLALCGCSTVPAYGEKGFTGLSSMEDDIKQGEAAYPQLVAVFGGAYENPRMQGYLTSVGQRLAAQSEAPDLPWEFTLVNSPILNAFALPGGKIAVTRGIMALANSEAELAGVVAHEIGHVTARHSARQQTRGLLAQLGLLAVGIGTGNAQLMQGLSTVAQGFMQSYSRGQELEADKLGVRYIDRLNYDPEAMATFLNSMREQAQLEARMRGLPEGQVDEFNWLASHPRTIERVRQAIEEAGTRERGGVQKRPEFLDALNGMLYGDDPSQGIVTGQKFIHPGLGFAFEVPERFILNNSPEAVVAQGPAGAVIALEPADFSKSRSLGDYLQNTWLSSIPLRDLRSGRAEGVDAVTGWALIRAQQGELYIRASAFQVSGGPSLRMISYVNADYANNFAKPFADTFDSMRRVSASEADSIQPYRLIVVNAQPGDTVDALSRGLPHGAYNEEWFRLLNDVPAGAGVEPGRSLKVVVGSVA